MADRLYDALAVVALPAPYLVRLAACAMLVLGLVAGATVASADSLPSDPLYPVKLATEQVRLALAQSAQDRAAVQLSMAEHRLVEAERLALRGRQPEALVAGSTYGADLAGAAADLARIERSGPEAAGVVAQLKQRLSEQQSHASRVATELAGDPGAAAIAPVFRTVASFAPPQPSGVTVSEAIARHAADVAGQLAAAADEIAQASEESSRHDAGARPGARAGVAASPDIAAPKAPPVADTSPRDAGGEKNSAAGTDNRKDDRAPDARRGPTHDASSTRQGRKDGAAPTDAVRAPRTGSSAPARPRVDPQAARDAADRAKHEAEKARESAEKAKEAARKVPAATHGRSGDDAKDDDAKEGKGRP